MPKKSNIAGVRFGSLVAVEPTDNRDLSTRYHE